MRLWRCCDVGGMKAHVRSGAFRASCPECGTAAREVLWAAHGSRLANAFEDTCCWCALSMGKVACQKLMRVSWRTVGSICPGVEARLSEARPPVPGGLVRIGVDGTSYRKGCKCFLSIRSDQKYHQELNIPMICFCTSRSRDMASLRT